jgi:hypothetical protein
MTIQLRKKKLRRALRFNEVDRAVAVPINGLERAWAPATFRNRSNHFSLVIVVRTIRASNPR